MTRTMGAVRPIGVALLLVVAGVAVWPGAAAGAGEKNSQESTTIELDATAHSGGAVAVSDSPWNDCTFRQQTAWAPSTSTAAIEGPVSVTPPPPTPA